MSCDGGRPVTPRLVDGVLRSRAQAVPSGGHAQAAICWRKRAPYKFVSAVAREQDFGLATEERANESEGAHGPHQPTGFFIAGARFWGGGGKGRLGVGLPPRLGQAGTREKKGKERRRQNPHFCGGQPFFGLIVGESSLSALPRLSAPSLLCITASTSRQQTIEADANRRTPRYTLLFSCSRVWHKRWRPTRTRRHIDGASTVSIRRICHASLSGLHLFHTFALSSLSAALVPNVWTVIKDCLVSFRSYPTPAGLLLCRFLLSSPPTDDAEYARVGPLTSTQLVVDTAIYPPRLHVSALSHRHRRSGDPPLHRVAVVRCSSPFAFCVLFLPDSASPIARH